MSSLGPSFELSPPRSRRRRPRGAWAPCLVVTLALLLGWALIGLAVFAIAWLIA